MCVSSNKSAYKRTSASGVILALTPFSPKSVCLGVLFATLDYLIFAPCRSGLVQLRCVSRKAGCHE
jgi:hypothetical protein